MALELSQQRKDHARMSEWLAATLRPDAEQGSKKRATTLYCGSRWLSA
jgi:hypothetical protein